MTESDALNLNAQVAERLGWTLIEPDEEAEEDGLFIGRPPDWNIHFASVPNYTTSLDACRDLLDRLTEEQWGRFLWQLEADTEACKHSNPYETYRALLTASPETLVKAFLAATDPAK